ncbi:hypothetical protein MASR1M36_04170 [Candidatus Cloacimonadaceae bacterium]
MKNYLIILVLLGLGTIISAVTIQHASPETFSFAEDTQLVVEVLQGLNDISEMKLNYRIGDDERWLSETVKQENPGSVYFKVDIPGKYLSTDLVEYYFSIKLNHGIVEDFPAQDGVATNYSLKSNLSEGDASPGFVLLTDQGSVSADQGYLLVVSFFALQGEIDPASIELWVGGKNVSSAAQISAPTIVYRDEHPPVGDRKAIVRAKIGPKSIHSQTWTTTITPGTKSMPKPFNLRGSVNFASNYYNYSQTKSILTPESDAASWADLYANYGIVDMQTHLYLSSLEHTNKQPVNRFNVGINIPYLELFLGDYSPSISQLSMNNQNLRGIYGKLHTNKVALILAHGQTLRKTSSETDIAPSIDGIQKTGTFKQEALAARLQFGNEAGFMMGFNLTRHRDIVSSLKSEYYQYSTTDTLNNIQTVYTTPARDNAVLSYDLRINIPEQKTVIGAEVSGSLLNYNTIPGPITQAEMEEYTGEDSFVDPAEYANLFVFNKNMEPFIPGRANLAWLMYLRSYFWNNMISAQYAQTGSAFNALGTSYQRPDSKVISISDQLNISRYLVINGSFNLSSDNLMEHKRETTTTLSYNLQSLLRIPKLPYLKAAYYASQNENKANQKIVSTPIDIFTGKSSALSFGMGYNLSQIPIVPTQFDISYRVGNDDYEKKDTLAVIQKLAENESNGLNITMLNRFANYPLTLQFAYALNNQDNLLNNLNNENQNLLFGAGYSFWQNRLKPYLNYRTISLSGDQGKQNYAYFTLGVEAYPISSFMLNTSLGFQNYSNKTNAGKNYDNLIWRVLLTQRF